MNSFKKLVAATALSFCVLCGVFWLSGCAAQTVSTPEPPVQENTDAPQDVPGTPGADAPAPDTDGAADTNVSATDASTPGSTDAGWDPDISFTTVDMDGNTWTDACFAEHTLTVVNLWASWCGPCVGEMPDLQKLSEDYASRGVQFLGIYDEYDEPDNIATVQELGITYPCLRYTADFDPYMNTGYIPVTIFLDSDGKVLSDPYIGSKSYDDWAAVIDGYLK